MSLILSSSFLKGKTITPGQAPPSVPAWWSNVPNVPAINVNGWTPVFDTYGWNGYYELAVSNQSTDIGINALEVATVRDSLVQVPLYDSNGQLTSYLLKMVVDYSDPDSPFDFNFEGNIGLAIYDGDQLIDDYSMHVYWDSNSQYPQTAYVTLGVDTIDYIDYRGSREVTTKHGVIWGAVIIKGHELYGSSDYVGYFGNALDISFLGSQYGLYLGAEWYTPSN